LKEEEEVDIKDLHIHNITELKKTTNRGRNPNGKLLKRVEFNFNNKKLKGNNLNYASK